MTVRAALGIGVAVLVVQSLAAQAPVFRSSVELVSVDVSVRRDNRPVPGLGPRDFEVLDNGRVQTLMEVSYESWPIEITVLADLSSSVDGALLASLKHAIDRVGAALRPTDRVHLVSFNQSIRESPIAPGTAVLSTALAAPAGGTSLFDAIVAASIRPRDPGYRQMIVAFTDGQDTMSFLDEKTVIAVARASGATIFIVAVTEGVAPGRSTILVPHETLFTHLTETTGGLLTVLSRSQELGGAFVRAFEEFRSSYVIRYVPDAPGPGWHDIAVRVIRPGRFDVRSRQGYRSDHLPLQSSP